VATIEPTIPVIERDVDRAARLHRTWGNPGGFFGWFKTVDHKAIGRRFFVTSFIFFLVGGILASLMRLQLARPENRFLGPDQYNQIFTVHGSTMIFLFAVPMMFQAFSIYLVPLMVGARNIAFPRLVAFSYYILTAGGIFFLLGLALNIGGDAGWFGYPPLSGPAFSPGKRVDFWAQMITFTELSALTTAVPIIVTILRHRAPGMTLNRMPIFCWSALTIAFMIVFAMPAVMVSSSMLLMDRLVATHFFNPAEGGDVLLYQHLFWFFGHPDVYIIFLPGTSITSTLVANFSRRKDFGYEVLVVSTVATGFLGFSVWVHHMFATGLPQISTSFFTAASLMIVIPTATQFFCWTATLWHGKLWFRVPILFIFGFFFIFLIGGMSGVTLASVPLDWQVHDSFYVVAHFHYVLIGSLLFPMFAALYYWMPKITGRMMSEALGHVNFWLFFIGFNMTFFPMHILGMRGMTRRIYTYVPDRPWANLNLLATIGAAFMAAGLLVFIYNFFWSQRAGAVAGENPWYAGTLEWATSSPPPPYNFLELHTVGDREPLWYDPPDSPIVTGVREDVREELITHAVDADPDHKQESPKPSAWPFWTAITTSAFFIGTVFTQWAVFVGLAVAVTLIGWFWPNRRDTERIKAEERWAH
jgi:cytochrome c oxidase subunit I+III